MQKTEIFVLKLSSKGSAIVNEHLRTTLGAKRFLFAKVSIHDVQHHSQILNHAAVAHLEH